MEPNVTGRAFVVFSLALLAALALLSGRQGYPNDRRLGVLAGFSLIMTMLAVTLVMIVGPATFRSSRSPTLAGGVLGVVVGAFFGHVILAGLVIGRSRRMSNSAIAPDARDARG